MPLQPAFVAAAMAARPNTSPKRSSVAPPPSADGKSAPRKQTRKRVRVSELTRKYRRNVRDFDEALLVNDANAPLLQSDAEIPIEGVSALDVEFMPPTSATTAMSIPPTVAVYGRDAVAAAAAAAAASLGTATSVAASTEGSSRVMQGFHNSSTTHSASRFPNTWNDALNQMSDSVATALAHGFDRVRVEFEAPTTFAGAISATDADNQNSCPIRNEPMVHVDLLAYATCVLLSHLVGADAAAPCTDAVTAAGSSVSTRSSLSLKCSFAPKRVVVLFDSRAAMESSSEYLSMASVAPRNVIIGVLGEVDLAQFVGALIVVIAPSNCRGNPSHIETVEHVHYSNFNQRNWVILLNPNLISLSSMPSLSTEPRSPLFLDDYVSAYYVNPLAFESPVAAGAILRNFPRKWELYLNKVGSFGGFRLVSEQKARPSRERVQCEFGWRVEREIEDMLL